MNKGERIDLKYMLTRGALVATPKFCLAASIAGKPSTDLHKGLFISNKGENGVLTEPQGTGHWKCGHFLDQYVKQTVSLREQITYHVQGS